MVSYIQWYHEMNNGEKLRKKISIEYEKEEIDAVLKCISGSVRLLRTGATAGTPYRYNVYRVFIQLFQQNIQRSSDRNPEATPSALLSFQNTGLLFQLTHWNSLI